MRDESAPTVTVDYDTMEYAFDVASFDRPYTNQVYLSKESGQFYYDSMYLEEEFHEKPPEDADASDTYIRVPHKNELDLGFSLVRKFVRTHMPDEMSRVSNMFSSRGAYRRYKQFLAEKEMLNDWHRFEEEQKERALRRWCERKGIALREDDG